MNSPFFVFLFPVRNVQKVPFLFFHFPFFFFCSYNRGACTPQSHGLSPRNLATFTKKNAKGKTPSTPLDQKSLSAGFWTLLSAFFFDMLR